MKYVWLCEVDFIQDGTRNTRHIVTDEDLSLAKILERLESEDNLPGKIAAIRRVHKPGYMI